MRENGISSKYQAFYPVINKGAISIAVLKHTMIQGD